MKNGRDAAGVLCKGGERRLNNLWRLAETGVLFPVALRKDDPPFMKRALTGVFVCRGIWVAPAFFRTELGGNISLE